MSTLTQEINQAVKDRAKELYAQHKVTEMNKKVVKAANSSELYKALKLN
jgi:hypothetical protein